MAGYPAPPERQAGNIMLSVIARETARSIAQPACAGPFRRRCAFGARVEHRQAHHSVRETYAAAACLKRKRGPASLPVPMSPDFGLWSRGTWGLFSAACSTRAGKGMRVLRRSPGPVRSACFRRSRHCIPAVGGPLHDFTQGRNHGALLDPISRAIHRLRHSACAVGQCPGFRLFGPIASADLPLARAHRLGSRPSGQSFASTSACALVSASGSARLRRPSKSPRRLRIALVSQPPSLSSPRLVQGGFPKEPALVGAV